MNSIFKLLFTLFDILVISSNQNIFYTFSELLFNFRVLHKTQ